MEFVEKAILDTVVGANLNREDLSNTLSLTDGPKRPVTQGITQVPATNTTHQWNEQGLNTAGRTNVAGGGATYAQGNLPPTNAKSVSRQTNVTCRTGRTAQVTDDQMAAFNGGGAVRLADGEMERLIQDALDFETALVTIECLNQIEWMHIMGDSSNSTMEGGETDGIVKWTTAGGYAVNTGGSDSAPAFFTEQFIKDGARGVALTMPAMHADTLLAAPELLPDINATVATGSGRPIVQIASGQNANLVGGNQVGWYNTGYSVLEIKEEPYLSPAYNSALPQAAMIAYKKDQIKQANLVKFNAEPLARIDTSVKRMVTCVYAQEHRVAKHTWIAKDLKSAVS